MQELSEKLKCLSVDEHDDELVREHLLSLLKVWVFRCFDHVRSIDQEIEILETMTRMRRGDVARQPEAAPPPARPPMKPIVITRETLKVLNYTTMSGYCRFYIHSDLGAIIQGVYTLLIISWYM